jgi:hypothetical protein
MVKIGYYLKNHNLTRIKHDSSYIKQTRIILEVYWNSLTLTNRIEEFMMFQHGKMLLWFSRNFSGRLE